jgi:hypothetical protein
MESWDVKAERKTEKEGDLREISPLRGGFKSDRRRFNIVLE